MLVKESKLADTSSANIIDIMQKLRLTACLSNKPYAFEVEFYAKMVGETCIMCFKPASCPIVAIDDSDTLTALVDRCREAITADVWMDDTPEYEKINLQKAFNDLIENLDKFC